jgi:hypothetical protein
MCSEQALLQICHFLAQDDGAWTAKDLKDLAALQATCQEARSRCCKAAKMRKPAAQAHRALMEDLHDYLDFRVNDARDEAKYSEKDDWVHPFTGEVFSTYPFEWLESEF